MKLNYSGTLYDSWQKFKKNIVLVVPTLISIGLSLGLVFVVAIQVAFMAFFSNLGGKTIETLFSMQNLPWLIIFGIIDFIIIALISSYIRAMELGMAMDVMTKGKTDTKNMFMYGKKFLFKYFKTSLLMLLLFIPAMLIFLAFRLIPDLGIYIGAFLAGFYTIFLIIFLFFIEPIVVYKKGSAIDMIRLSVDYSKRNTKHVFITLGIMLLVTLTIFTPLTVIESLLELGEGYFFALLFSAFVFIRNIINVVVGIVLRLFQFKTYLSKK